MLEGEPRGVQERAVEPRRRRAGRRARAGGRRRRASRRRSGGRSRSGARESGACGPCGSRRAPASAPGRSVPRRRSASRRPAPRRARADIFLRSTGSRPIGASIRRPACTSPQTSATYSFSTSRSWNCRASSSCDGVVLGDDHQPRRAAVEAMDDARAAVSPPMPLRSWTWCSSALTSVPPAWPAAGWTTIPAGLSTTTRSRSS